jgi:hypothetical protein
LDMTRWVAGQVFVSGFVRYVEWGEVKCDVGVRGARERAAKFELAAAYIKRSDIFFVSSVPPPFSFRSSSSPPQSEHLKLTEYLNYQLAK